MWRCLARVMRSHYGGRRATAATSEVFCGDVRGDAGRPGLLCCSASGIANKPGGRLGGDVGSLVPSLLGVSSLVASLLAAWMIGKKSSGCVLAAAAFLSID